ncbi:MAG TPA: D-aminoacylase, partial [Blastocatellia bacterium]
MRFRIPLIFILAFTLIAPAQTQQNAYDTIIKNGVVYDGTGGEPRRADVGIKGDRVAAVGDLKSAKAATVIDAGGLAVAPGFINMLSWAVDDLVVDGRSLGDIKQGVTTEIFGEGDSMGPLNDEMKRRRKEAQGDLKFEIEWTTLAEYLQYLEKRGVSANVA